MLATLQLSDLSVLTLRTNHHHDDESQRDTQRCNHNAGMIWLHTPSTEAFQLSALVRMDVNDENETPQLAGMNYVPAEASAKLCQDGHGEGVFYRI